MMKASLQQYMNFIYIVILGFVCLALAEEGKGKCSKKVLVTKENNQKVAMIKRIPSKCSNWDRSWAWITKMDCGTRYVTTYVNNPIYMIQYYCCPDDTSCKDKSAQEYASEERFLLITFGSATAVLVIIVLIIVISICHRKYYGSNFIFWKRQRCQYIATNGKGSDLSLPYNVDSRNENEYITGEQKLIEPEYEEISDRTPDDWCSDKLPVSDGVTMDTYDIKTKDEKMYQNKNMSEQNSNENNEFAKLQSFKEYVKSSTAQEILQKDMLQGQGYISQGQGHENNELAGAVLHKDKMESNDQGHVEQKKNELDNGISDGRVHNKYRDFDDLMGSKSLGHDLHTNDNIHKYECLDDSTREQTLNNRVYSPIESAIKTDQAQNLC